MDQGHNGGFTRDRSQTQGCIQPDEKEHPLPGSVIQDTFHIPRQGIQGREESRERTEKSFFVPAKEIVENEYDLSINKYKKTEYVAVEYASTEEILAEIREIEREIAEGIEELEGML